MGIPFHDWGPCHIEIRDYGHEIGSQSRSKLEKTMNRYNTSSRQNAFISNFKQSTHFFEVSFMLALRMFPYWEIFCFIKTCSVKLKDTWSTILLCLYYLLETRLIKCLVSLFLTMNIERPRRVCIGFFNSS